MTHAPAPEPYPEWNLDWDPEWDPKWNLEWDPQWDTDFDQTPPHADALCAPEPADPRLPPAWALLDHPDPWERIGNHRAGGGKAVRGP
ncbi:hypothetical protein [Mycolicibacterium peregrinum]|uniref:hypothetical protein n=1 Tax=Mycolicibacterium peregrinum TaxID=43304 RepID=UPI000AB2D6E1|nr:hypothetical protein [Mycolicibacterium peregrinum]